MLYVICTIYINVYYILPHLPRYDTLKMSNALVFNAKEFTAVSLSAVINTSEVQQMFSNSKKCKCMVGCVRVHIFETIEYKSSKRMYQNLLLTQYLLLNISNKVTNYYKYMRIQINLLRIINQNSQNSKYVLLHTLEYKSTHRDP